MSTRTAEPTISIRLVWPFTRVLGGYSTELAIIQASGLKKAEFANPDTRIPFRLAVELLGVSIDKSGDPALGLHAGELIEPGDLDVVEYAARHCATAREGILCSARLIRLLHEAVDVELVEEGEQASWRATIHGPGARPAGLYEFIIAVNLVVARRMIGMRVLPLEVHFSHTVPSSAAEYARFFGCPVVLGHESNEIVMVRQALDAPLPLADPDLRAAFEQHGDQLLARLPTAESIGSKVRKLTIASLGEGDVGMEAIAKRLHMSVATLRRRLKDEGTTHSQILDDLRFELAKRYLRRPDLAVSEIAYSLGFSHVNAFHKAFKRWTGSAPVEYRARYRAGATSA
jgi:AraC-like DNA-binding protein